MPRAKDESDRRRPYVKPAVLYRRRMEVLAKICDSDWINPMLKSCRTAIPACTKLKD